MNKVRRETAVLHAGGFASEEAAPQEGKHRAMGADPRWHDAQMPPAFFVTRGGRKVAPSTTRITFSP